MQLKELKETLKKCESGALEIPQDNDALEITSKVLLKTLQDNVLNCQNTVASYRKQTKLYDT